MDGSRPSDPAVVAPPVREVRQFRFGMQGGVRDLV